MRARRERRVAARAPAGDRVEDELAGQPGPADEITAATCAAHERAADGTRFAGPAEVAGFAAVEDARWLTLGGTPAISYGPGDLAWPTPTTSTS